MQSTNPRYVIMYQGSSLGYTSFPLPTSYLSPIILTHGWLYTHDFETALSVMWLHVLGYVPL